MPKLTLGFISAFNERVEPLMNGAVKAEGIELIPTYSHPAETFWRQLKFGEFEVAEMSMSSFLIAKSRGADMVALPVFPSRRLFQTELSYNIDSAISKPEDLVGKKLGVAEYQLTANVWARALLEEDFGVKPADIHWIRGGLEEAGRLEKIPIKLPPDVRLEDAPAGAVLSSMLAAGTIDAFIGPRVPSCFERGHPNVGWLFPDPRAAASDYYARTGIFPQIPERLVQCFYRQKMSDR